MVHRMNQSLKSPHKNVHKPTGTIKVFRFTKNESITAVLGIPFLLSSYEIVGLGAAFKVWSALERIALDCLR